MAHDIVEQGIYAGRKKVEDARALVEDDVELPLSSHNALRRVDSYQTLGVKGTPAQEKGHDHSHWNTRTRRAAVN